MANRREFLHGGLAVTAVAGFAAQMGIAPAFAATEAPARLHKVIYDSRYTDSIAFAQAIGTAGVPAHGLDDGDVTALWFEDLDLRWRKRLVPIVGLTTQSSAFCLAELARSRGLRRLYHGEHIFHTREQVEHRLRGPRDLLTQTGALLRARRGWSVALAELIASHRVAPGADIVMRRLSAPLATPMPHGVKMLESWLFVPANRRT